MYLLLFLWVLCVLVFIVQGQCANSSVTSQRFENLKVTYGGCNNKVMSSATKNSRIDCARSCLASRICVSFTYDKSTKTCRFCGADDVTGLKFDGGNAADGAMYALRQGIQKPPMNVTSSVFTTLEIPCGVDVGTMVTYRGTEASNGLFYLCARQNDANMPVCLMTISDGGANKTSIWLFDYKNGVKSPPYVPEHSTFNTTRGQEIKLNILAGSEGYVIFRNGMLVSNYTYVLPLSVVQNFGVMGDVELFEFSI